MKYLLMVGAEAVCEFTDRTEANRIRMALDCILPRVPARLAQLSVREVAPLAAVN